MIRVPGMPIAMVKELRALLPVWLACMTVALALAMWSPDREATVWTLAVHELVASLGVLGFLLGPVMLGASAMGHEFHQGTLSSLLSQPVSRHQLFLAKLRVLVPMTLTAWVALGATLYLHGVFPFEPSYARFAGDEPLRAVDMLSRPFVILPVLAGLGLAPWLTMIGRSALAGVVLSLSVPLVFWLGVHPLTVAVYGAGTTATPEAVDFMSALVVRGTAALSAMAGFAGWATFRRLQVLESPARALALPRWPGAPSRQLSSARRSARGLLLGKELHLQVPTFAISGVYIVGWMGAIAYSRFDPTAAGDAMGAATTLYLCLTSLIAGALVTAEERQWETLDWQLLLPSPAWQQWTLKITVAITVGLLLAVGVPVLLSLLTPALGSRFFLLLDDEHPWLNGTIVAVLLTCVGIYVSSMSRSGLRALLGAMVVAAVSMPVLETWTRIVNRVLGALMPPLPPASEGSLALELELRLHPELWIATLTVLALRFSWRNHRFGEVTPWRAIGQFGWMLAWYAGLFLALRLLLLTLAA